jgi:RND family efflux transporter MFP subunit
MEMSSAQFRFLGFLALSGMASIASMATAQPPEPLTCLLAPWRSSDIGSDRSGIVAHVPVRRADFVAAGDALVQIDTTLAEADLRVAGITVAALEERLSRNEGLLERNLISRDEIGTLRAELELARAEQARAATHIARATIRAPFAGYITELGVAEGEMIGMEPLLRLIEVSRLRAEMVYRADAFGAIRTGDEITLHAELSAETITARVTAIDRFIDAASNTFTVAGEIDNRDLALVSGTACHVQGKLPTSAP